MTDIMITTYPKHKSKNVGDAMITSSLVSLIQNRMHGFAPTIVQRDKSLDGFTKKVSHNVIAPGFSVSNNTYPDLFALFTDIARLSAFMPVGCSFQSSRHYSKAYEVDQFNPETIKFLRELVINHGPLPCRDQMIVNMLDELDIGAFLCGDLVLFDKDQIGRDLVVPKAVNTVAVSLQHHIRYIEQVIHTLKLVRKRFPIAKCYVTLHSAKNNMDKVVATRAEEIGFEVINLSGPADNLDFYRSVDLHIGYRLHGHIYFLRNRKPSILFVEDNRAYGFSRTLDFSVGCNDAFNEHANLPDDEAPLKAMAYLDEQIDHNFSDYEKPLKNIDDLYKNSMSPHIDLMCDKLR